MTLEFLDKLSDQELNDVSVRVVEIRKARDAERKAKAVADARAIREKAQVEARELLAAVGLSLKAVAPKKRRASVRKHGGGGQAAESGNRVARKTG